MNFVKRNLPILVALLFGMTPVLWFWGRAGVLINGNDTNFPLNPVAWFGKRLYIWNDGLNGGQDASTTPAGLFFHSLQVLFFSITNSLQLTELLTFIFWFAAIPLSFYIFLRLVFKKFHPLAAIAGMTFYTFNIYLFNTWENAKVANLAVVVGLPILLGLLIYGLREGVNRRVLAGVGLIGFVTAGSGINPAYFLVFVLVLSGYVLFVLKQDIFKKDLRSLAAHFISSFKVFLVLLLANLFWLFTLFNKLFLSERGPVTDISQFGLVNWLRDLSQNTSVLNILRLQGAWDWYSFDGDLPLYIPYAPTYFNHPFFLAFSLLIPFLVLVSVVAIKRNRRLALFFATLFSLGIFFGVGAHGTLGNIYLWLAQNVPFFSFFRSPWYVFTPLVTISMSVLIFLLLGHLFGLRLQKRPVLKMGVSLAAFALIAANLFYTFPLVTGEIFRPNKRDNTFMLVIPNYVFETRDWLSGLGGNEGRILSFPNTPIERFIWGYSGLESVLQLLSDQDVVYPSFGITKRTTVDVLQERVHKALADGDFQDALRLASIFSVDRLFIKKDAVLPIGVNFEFTPDNAYLGDKELFGSWSFYSINKEYVLSRIYVPEKVVKVDGDLAAVADSRVIEDELGSVFFYSPQIEDKVFFEEAVSDRVFQVRNDELENFKTEIQEIEKIEDENTRHRRKYFERARFRPFIATYTMKVTHDGEYELLIEDFHLQDYGLGLDAGWDAVLDGQKVRLTPISRKGGWVYFKPLALQAGKHKLEILLPENPNLVEDGSFEESKWLGNKGISQGSDSVDGNYSLRLSATTEQAWVTKPIENFDPSSVYLLSVDYKREFGPRPTIIITQKVGEHTPRVQKEQLSLSNDWVFYETLVSLQDMPSTADLTIVADGNIEEGTSHLYDRLSLRRVFSNKVLLRKGNVEETASLPEVIFEKINPTKYKVKVENAKSPYFLVFSETFNPGWKLYLEDGTSTGPVGEEKHFVANGYANSWYVDKQGSYAGIIEYAPQRLFNFGLGISGVTFISSLIFLGLGFLKERRKR